MSSTSPQAHMPVACVLCCLCDSTCKLSEITSLNVYKEWLLNNVMVQQLMTGTLSGHVPSQLPTISTLGLKRCSIVTHVYKSNITGNAVHTTGPTYEGVQLVVVDYYVARRDTGTLVLAAPGYPKHRSAYVLLYVCTYGTIYKGFQFIQRAHY